MEFRDGSESLRPHPFGTMYERGCLTVDNIVHKTRAFQEFKENEKTFDSFPDLFWIFFFLVNVQTDFVSVCTSHPEVHVIRKGEKIKGGGDKMSRVSKLLVCERKYKIFF